MHKTDTTLALLALTLFSTAGCSREPPPPEWSRTLTTNETGTVYDIALGGPGFVAVGTTAGRGAAWTSADGENWNLHTASSPTLAFYAVAPYAGGLVAVGWGIWTSVDGTS